MIASIQITSDVYALIAEEATRRGMRFEELAGLKLAGAVLAESERVRTSRRSTPSDLQRIAATLKRFGVERADFAIAAAMEKGLSEAAIQERISTWRRLPENERKPGKLCNWIASKKSYESALKRSSDRLVAEFGALEVHGAAELLGRASRKVGWDYLERLLRFYQSKPGSWGPGALRCRVQASQPGLAIEHGWPPPHATSNQQTEGKLSTGPRI